MNIEQVADKEWTYLNQHYSTEKGYQIIMKHFIDL